ARRVSPSTKGWVGGCWGAIRSTPMRSQRGRGGLGSVLAIFVLIGWWGVGAGHLRAPFSWGFAPFLGGVFVVVRGLVGSEKVALFADPAVKRVLRQHGLVVEVEPAGSRVMACRADLAHYDFAFPGSPWAAADVLRAAAIQQPSVAGRVPVPVIESPIVVA